MATANAKKSVLVLKDWKQNDKYGFPIRYSINNKPFGFKEFVTRIFDYRKRLHDPKLAKKNPIIYQLAKWSFHDAKDKFRRCYNIVPAQWIMIYEMTRKYDFDDDLIARMATIGMSIIFGYSQIQIQIQIQIQTQTY